MLETIEFRISESKVQKHLPSIEGELLGGSVRKIVLPFADERVQKIGEIDQSMGGIFFGSWRINRKYKKEELNKAELLKVIIRKIFEPTGEECGTLYDENAACLRCGLNREQTGDLILDIKQLRKNIDIAKTIAGEVIVSKRFVDFWGAHKFKGANFRPVLQKGKMSVVSKEWYQIVKTSKNLAIASPTQAGNTPFDNDPEGRYKCPGHVLGLNLISELTVLRQSYDGSDLVITEQAFGWKQGLLMPERPLIISQRAWEYLTKAEIKGFDVEVVHLC